MSEQKWVLSRCKAGSAKLAAQLSVKTLAYDEEKEKSESLLMEQSELRNNLASIEAAWNDLRRNPNEESDSYLNEGMSDTTVQLSELHALRVELTEEKTRRQEVSSELRVNQVARADL